MISRRGVANLIPQTLKLSPLFRKRDAQNLTRRRLQLVNQVRDASDEHVRLPRLRSREHARRSSAPAPLPESFNPRTCVGSSASIVASAPHAASDDPPIARRARCIAFHLPPRRPRRRSRARVAWRAKRRAHRPPVSTPSSSSSSPSSSRATPSRPSSLAHRPIDAFDDGRRRATRANDASTSPARKMGARSRHSRAREFHRIAFDVVVHVRFRARASRATRARTPASTAALALVVRPRDVRARDGEPIHAMERRRSRRGEGQRDHPRGA